MGPVVGAFDSVRSVLSIVAKLGMDKLLQLVDLAKRVGNEDLEVKDRVLAAISAADIIVDFTSTQADDLVVEFLRNAAQEESLWKIVDIVGYLLEGKGIPVGALPDDGLQVGDPKDPKGFIPLPVAIQLAQIIATIILALRNRK